MGIGLNQGVFGVGQHYNRYQVSYVIVNDYGQEQESYHSMNPQNMMTNYILPPQIPEQPSLQSIMLSLSSLPHSYLMYQQPSMMQQIQQLSPSSPSPSPQPPPPLPLTIGGIMPQHYHGQCINGCDNSGTTNIGERVTSDSLPYLHQLKSEKRTVATSMTSSVNIHDSILSRQQQSNNDDIVESTPPSTVTKIKPTNEIKKQKMMSVDDNKVVTVCKQTILSAMNKIIANNYESALYKLRKIIRVLDILMFNEGGSGIGSARIETVRPWLETLKDMEERVSLKHRQQHKKK